VSQSVRLGASNRRLTTPGLLGAITHTTQNGECTRVTVASLELQEGTSRDWGLKCKARTCLPKVCPAPPAVPAPFCLTTDPTEKKGTCLLVHRFAGGAGQPGRSNARRRWFDLTRCLAFNASPLPRPQRTHARAEPFTPQRAASARVGTIDSWIELDRTQLGVVLPRARNTQYI